MTMFVDDYVRQVERACADLPDDQRRRLIADLAEHLREVDTATGSVYAELGPPDEYARELRVALDLPPAPPQYSPTRFFALSGPDRRSGWTVLGATIVLVVLVIVIAVVVNRPGSSRSFVPTPIASAPASQASAAPAPSTSAATSTVLMPSVVGGSLATARLGSSVSGCSCRCAPALRVPAHPERSPSRRPASDRSFPPARP